MSGVVFVNPEAGGGGLDVDDLRSRLRGHRVETCRPDELANGIRAALEESVSFVGVAGGDGTIGTAAGLLADGGVPLLPIPGGTRNHFAKDLGMTSLDEVQRAVDGGVVRSIDLGVVGDRVFVNNASIGAYPAMVRRRERHERRFRKGVSNVMAIIEQVRHGRRVVTEVDGVARQTWSVFIGNGRYGEGLADLMCRESMDDGVLDVRVVNAAGQLTRVRVLAATATGRLASSRLVERITASEVCVDVRHHQIDVALDGEVVTLSTPLVVRCRPGALGVMVPPS